MPFKRGRDAARGKDPRPKGKTGPRTKKPVRAAAKRVVLIAPPAATEAHDQETLEVRRVRTARIVALLHEAYPDAACALQHGSAYELLAATILSAQCTDDRVNKVTPTLFTAYPDARTLAAAAQADLEAAIRSCGFYRNKAKSLLGMARLVAERHGNHVPDSMEALLALPGVARKTANCVLGTWFHKNEGIVVDTHVGRLAHRLALTTSARNTKDAERIERDLMEVVPQPEWTFFSHALIQHGRRTCTARKPQCAKCILNTECPSAFAFEPPRPARRPAPAGGRAPARLALRKR